MAVDTDTAADMDVVVMAVDTDTVVMVVDTATDMVDMVEDAKLQQLQFRFMLRLTDCSWLSAMLILYWPASAGDSHAGA